MAKIHFDTNMIEDPGVYHLAELLGIRRRQALAHLCALYLWAADYSYDGMCIAYSKNEVADAALYTGDVDRFEEALEDSGWFTDHYHTLRDFETFVELPESGRLPLEEWKPIRAHILKRDNMTCHYCGRSGLSAWQAQVDHMIPVKDGGSNDYFNLVTACRRCNLRKGTKSYNEFMGMP